MFGLGWHDHGAVRTSRYGSVIADKNVANVGCARGTTRVEIQHDFHVDRFRCGVSKVGWPYTYFGVLQIAGIDDSGVPNRAILSAFAISGTDGHIVAACRADDGFEVQPLRG